MITNFSDIAPNLVEANKFLRLQLEQAFINSNFGCYNRAGAEIRGNEFLERERRRVESGELVMVTVDVAGMGMLNSQIGEIAVNQAIRRCLEEVRSWRGVEFVSQLNSGDEFVFVVDRVHVGGIIDWMDALFKMEGFKGVYAASVEIVGCYIESANKGMRKVYDLKKNKISMTKKQQPQLLDFSGLDLSSTYLKDAGYQQVHEFMAEMRKRSYIVTATDMLTNQCLMVNDLQASDRGGGWKGRDWVGLNFMTLWRDSFEAGNVNYFQQLINLIQKDNFIPNFEYLLRAPNGDLRRYWSYYFLVENYLDTPARICVSVPGNWETID